MRVKYPYKKPSNFQGVPLWMKPTQSNARQHKILVQIKLVNKPSPKRFTIKERLKMHEREMKST